MNKHIGSNFNDFLKEEIINEVIEAIANKIINTEVLEIISKDKNLKNKVIDGVIERLFGKGKVSWLLKAGVKGYLAYNYRI